jgi:2-deoxy-D-gluconate 3-dehydrogenase
MFDLTGRTALVTGGSRGLGRAIALALAGQGADVAINYLGNAEAADEVAQLITGSGRQAVTIQGDTSAGREACEAIVKGALDGLGSVDILVNNAGIYPMQPMLDLPRESWQRVIDINLTGLAFVSKAAANQMIEQGSGGKIINIASIDALHPSMVGLAAYDSSKGGVLMFTRAFALEVAPHGVTVNAIAPGGISTEGTAAPLQGSGMTEEQMRAMTEQFAAAIPLRRMGEPDDIAKVTLFLASPASDYMTGELIVVDGGVLLS